MDRVRRSAARSAGRAWGWRAIRRSTRRWPASALAEAQVEVEHAGLLPQVNGSAQVNRAHIGSKLLPPPIGGSSANLALAGGSLSWDLDLFGRQRAAVRQAGASADAARLDVAAARLMLSVSIAQTYVGLARAERLIEVADGFVATRQRALGFTQSRIKNQLASKFNLDQAQTLLAEAQQARTQAVQQRDVLVHALAALAGRGADFYPQIAKPTLALDQARRRCPSCCPPICSAAAPTCSPARRGSRRRCRAARSRAPPSCPTSTSARWAASPRSGSAISSPAAPAPMRRGPALSAADLRGRPAARAI